MNSLLERLLGRDGRQELDVDDPRAVAVHPVGGSFHDPDALPSEVRERAIVVPIGDVVDALAPCPYCYHPDQRRPEVSAGGRR